MHLAGKAASHAYYTVIHRKAKANSGGAVLDRIAIKPVAAVRNAMGFGCAFPETHAATLPVVLDSRYTSLGIDISKAGNTA
jgi:hypothetical protein